MTIINEDRELFVSVPMTAQDGEAKAWTFNKISDLETYQRYGNQITRIDLQSVPLDALEAIGAFAVKMSKLNSVVVQQDNYSITVGVPLTETEARERLEAKNEDLRNGCNAFNEYLAGGRTDHPGYQEAGPIRAFARRAGVVVPWEKVSA